MNLSKSIQIQDGCPRDPSKKDHQNNPILQLIGLHILGISLYFSQYLEMGKKMCVRTSFNVL